MYLLKVCGSWFRFLPLILGIDEINVTKLDTVYISQYTVRQYKQWRR